MAGLDPWIPVSATQALHPYTNTPALGQNNCYKGSKISAKDDQLTLKNNIKVKKISSLVPTSKFSFQIVVGINSPQMEKKLLQYNILCKLEQCSNVDLLHFSLAKGQSLLLSF